MPTIGKSVQFRGIDNAVTAYENMKIPRWGLFQGSQFLMKYEGTNLNEGAELLEQYLKSLDLRSADSNTYTLCIYDTAEKINNATKYDASFNFRLADNIADHYENKYSGALDQRIAGIENKLNQLFEDPEPVELSPKEKFFEALGRILEVPQVQAALAQKVMGIIDGVGAAVGGMFTPAAQQPRAAIGATKTAPQPTDAESENIKLQQAITMLIEVDPALGTNLLKLAGIAKADPEKYRLMITMLKSM